jgi:hypothetical protein
MSIPIEVGAPGGCPVTIRADGAAGAPGWAAGRREERSRLLLAHGAVLVTGLGLASAAGLARVRDALGLRPAAVREQFAARSELADGVYSAPEWAADREQCLHHEQGYGVDFPRVLLMTCLAAPDAGGALLLGDTRAVLGALPPGLAARFRAEGWLLERNFRPHFGLPWPAAFGAATPEQAERFCAGRLIGCAWQPGGGLRTSQRRSAIIHHPVTGEACWFNDVAFFSQWSVNAVEREVMISAFGPHGLPFNTWYGGGEPLAEADWRSVFGAYGQVLRRVPCREGDLLVVDNVLCAHGREPYSGRWQVAVGPAETVALADCGPTVAPAPGRGG